MKSKKLPLTLVERVKQWNRLLFDCNCKTNPYCIHPKMKLSKLLLELRLSGLNISQITHELSRNYDLFIYPGDLLSWLDEIIHAIQSVARLAKAMKNDEVLGDSKQLALAVQSANPTYWEKSKTILEHPIRKANTTRKPIGRKLNSKKRLARKRRKNPNKSHKK